MTPIERAEQLMVKAGLNKNSLAVALGMPGGTVYNWFNRGRLPTKHQEQLAEALGTTTEYLMSGDILSMNANKLERVLQGQSTLAQRVYNCVPKNQTWTSSQIASHYGRDYPPAKINVIDGCLYSLKESGAVREVMKGQWIKAPISNDVKTDDVEIKLKEELNKVEEPEKTEVKPMLKLAKKPETETQTESDPLALIGDITSRMKGLMEELEDAAVAVSEMIAVSDKKSEQLTELKKLLRNIAD